MSDAKYSEKVTWEPRKNWRLVIDKTAAPVVVRGTAQIGKAGCGIDAGQGDTETRK